MKYAIKIPIKPGLLPRNFIFYYVKENTRRKEEWNMFQSRCGVCCDLCERKDAVSCKGCINMDGPFWGGVCEVKSCCESKGLNHCGECGDFPCNVLSNMGVEEGYDPAVKIEQCRQWVLE